MGPYFVHDRAEPRDRTGPEVIAVAESAGEDDDVTPLQVVILVPEIDGFFAECLDDAAVRVVVAVGAGESDDAELHGCDTDAISKSSVTGFARSCAHMRVVCSRASPSCLASISST